jgi:hypothetical protein
VKGEITIIIIIIIIIIIRGEMDLNLILPEGRKSECTKEGGVRSSGVANCGSRRRVMTIAAINRNYKLCNSQTIHLIFCYSEHWRNKFKW